jgi:Dolichyl-phosphate-mannose-protein mannosyltransferase
MNSGRAAGDSLLNWVCASAVIGGAGLLLFAKAVGSGVNHDEHQFIAPGVLLAREGLLPYRDYALFHLPNLVFVYALLDRITFQPFLAARIFNAACAWVLVALIFGWSFKRLTNFGRWRCLAAVIPVLLLIGSPLFFTSSCKTWNHDLPVLLTMCAFVLQLHATRHTSVNATCGAGLLLGLAIGTRLTFAPLAAPFVIALWFSAPERRLILSLCFAGAVAIALLPTLVMAFAWLDQFFFGNFEFPRLRLLDPTDERAHKTIVWWRKLRFFFKEIVRSNWAVFGALAILIVPWMRRGSRNRQHEVVTWLLVLPFVLIGCFAPTRYQTQHFYLVLPFLVIAIVAGVGSLDLARRRDRLVLATVSIVSAMTIIAHADAYRNVTKLNAPGEWKTNEVRQLGEQLKHLAGSGRILTLAPIYPLEGGLQIYREFVTGPFGWRLAHLATAEQRRASRLVAPWELALVLANDQPAAILTGFEKAKLEEALIHYARTHGFYPTPLGAKGTVWLKQRSP